jgi:hypothetical protein
MIAAIPKPVEIMGIPQAKTIDLLSKMGVRIVDFHNEIITNSSCRDKYYFLTNKMYCLTIPTDADKLIHVDSDHLFYKEFGSDKRFSLPMNFVPAGYGGAVVYGGKFKEIYENMGAEFPMWLFRNKQMQLGTQQSQIAYSPPYVNTRFIAIRTELSQKLFNLWTHYFNKLEETKILYDIQREHSGQMSFNLALEKMKIPYEIMFYMKDDPPPYFHFDARHRQKGSDKARALAKELILEYPEMISIAKRFEDWELILRKNVLFSRIKRKIKNKFS